MTLIIMFVFSTSLAPFIGADQRNFLVVALSFAMPILFVAFRLHLTRDAAWMCLLLVYMMLVALHFGTGRDLSSISYTGLLAMCYLGLVSCLMTGLIERDIVVVFLRRLIFAFAIVSMLQAATSLTGLPVPNQLATKGLWSYNSLAVEPSHLGRVLPMSMLTYLILRRTAPGTTVSASRLLWQERWLVIAFLTSILLSGSTLAVMAAPIALLFAMPARWIVLLSGIAVILWPMISIISLPALQRGLNFILVLPSMNIDELVSTDLSAAVRVMPALVYFNKVEFSSSQFWFGGGISAIKPFLQEDIVGVADDQLGAGAFPGLIIAFGALGFGLLLYTVILRFLHPSTITCIALWLVLFLPSPWNSQLFWFGLMLLRILHYFEVEQKGALRRPSLGFRTVAVGKST
ncbi:hypothetical protein [Gemmobacter sp.]|uniref:hypothetical protein n=1 Tax=Gemmobacter sp. TaxID=1898957 RepID=UPI002AFFE7E9|nr:hypothetical protein [Gemmobacter sp.]